MRAKGYAGIIGARIGAVWGTALAAGAGHGVYVSSIETPGNRELGPDPSMVGKITRKPNLLHNRVVDVTIKGVLVYEGLEVLLAMFHGISGGVPTTVDTTGKKMVFKPKDDLDGIFGVIAYELIKDTLVVEIPSFKAAKLTLRGGQESPYVEFEVSGIGFDYEVASAINTTTTIDTVTFPTPREVALPGQCLWEMNNQTAGDVAGTPLYVKAWELNFERSLNRVFDSRNNVKTSEPIASDFMKVSGKWGFAVLEDGAGGNSGLLADQMAGTPKKAKLTMTGLTTVGGTTQKNQMLIWLPYLQLLPAKPGNSGPGAIAWEQPFEGFHVTAIPTGFTAGYTDAYTHEVINTRATDPLV